jgi:hypothetical protein
MVGRRMPAGQNQRTYEPCSAALVYATEASRAKKPCKKTPK